MEIELLGAPVRLALGGAAILFAVLALLTRRRERWVVPATAVAATCLLVLGAERVLAFAVSRAAPAGVDFNEWRWVLGAPWGRFGIAAGILICVVTIVLTMRGMGRERRLWRRAALVSLRAGACAAALVLFLEPALELRHVTREPNHVVVLVDDSRSMELGEKRGGATRADRAAALIGASSAALERWRKDHVVDFYTFSDGVLPAAEKDLATRVVPRGDATLLREALENLRARFEGGDLAGFVVISDGVATGRFADGVEDGASLDFLGGLGARVHGVWAGREGLHDLAVARVDAEEFAFVRTVFKVEAVIRQAGYPTGEIPVTLRRDGAVVKEETVVVPAGGEAHVVFEVVPDRVGKFVYEVSVPAREDEAVTTNNARAFVVRVIRDKIRVLQVAGRPSWDERALRGYFKADPNVDLISFFILRTHDDIQLVHQDEMALIPFPTEELFEEQLGSFDVVVMMNFEYGPYQIGPYLENIRAYVQKGGGLAVVGGDLAFSSGDYYGTQLAAALPLELLPGDPSDPRLISTESFEPRLTPSGVRHPIMQLRFDRRDNALRWGGLPALEGLNLTAGAKPDAVVLAEHPTLRTRNGRGMPVLAVGEYGDGRSLALTTDSSWRWGFVASGDPGDDGRGYAKFWENAVRWLIHDPDLEHLQVETDEAEYAPGAAPRLRAHLVDKEYQPARDAEISLQIIRGDPARAEVVLDKKIKTGENGDAHLELAPLPPGAYRVVARAKVGERKVMADDVFLVEAERAELEHPLPREDVLRGISEATGGRYLGAAEVLDPALPFAPPRVVRVDRRTDVELWSRPYLFFLAIGFLAAEWALRRRSGYL